MSQEGQGTEAKLSVKFTVHGIPPEQLRPLTSLPESEIEEFEKAVKAFYASAYPEAGVPQGDKDARKLFRLPDPDLEPDAYWVYGDRFDPKLLVLWGCEKRGGTSLPLIEDAKLAIKTAATVVQKLRQKAMNWEVMQSEALELIFARNEPIARFLAKPVINPQNNQLVGIDSRGTAIGLDKVNELSQLPASEIQAFGKAAKEFYSKAYPDASASAYEKALRKNFRLPDVDRKFYASADPKKKLGVGWTNGAGNAVKTGYFDQWQREKGRLLQSCARSGSWIAVAR